MSVLRRLTLLTLPFFVTACGAEESQVKTETPAQQVASAAQQDFDEAALKEKFSKLGLSIIDIQPSDVAGLVEIQTNGGVLLLLMTVIILSQVPCMRLTLTAATKM